VRDGRLIVEAEKAQRTRQLETLGISDGLQR
jgi:hypothetical protein